MIGPTVLLLAVASYVREELSPGGRPGVMAAIRAWGGTLSWATAALALGLKGIDRVLTGDQKARLADVVLRTWNWLDDQRRANYPKLLWKERTQRVILWVSASVFVFIHVWADSAFVFGRVLMLDEFSINRLRNVPWTVRSSLGRHRFRGRPTNVAQCRHRQVSLSPRTCSSDATRYDVLVDQRLLCLVGWGCMIACTALISCSFQQ